MRTIKCNGEHPDPACADPQCWRNITPQAAMGAAWITVNFDSAMVRYMLELVYADAARMRALTEHAKSRGERGVIIPETTKAKELAEVLLIALSMAVAKNFPVNPHPFPEATPEEIAILSDVWACLHSNAREAVIDGVASALTILRDGEVIGPARSKPGKST